MPRAWRIWALGALIFAFGFWQNLLAVDESPFHPDESRWLNRSHYVVDVLRPTSDVWEDRYLTRGQPPMGSYITGIGLVIQGLPLEPNGPWDFHYGNESVTVWNTVKGNMPAPDALIAARRTSSVIGAGSGVIVFLIVTRLINAFGGVVGALVFLAHPLQRYLGSLGVSDAVFTLFVAGASLAAMRLADRPSWLRAVTLGLILGCGASTKLSPIFVSLPFAVLGGVLVLTPILSRAPIARRGWGRIAGNHRSPARLGWMLLSLPAITAASFVLSYPYLWSNPIGRVRTLIAFRRYEMENQARIWPASAVDSRLEALQRIWTNLEHTYSATGRLFSSLAAATGDQWSRGGIDLPLALGGFCILTWLMFRHGLASPWGLMMIASGAQTAIIVAGLRVDFNRYYLPITFCVALGVGALAGQVAAIVAPAARSVVSNSHRRARGLLPVRAIRQPAPVGEVIANQRERSPDRLQLERDPQEWVRPALKQERRP